MTTIVSCPQCRQSLQVTPELVGAQVRCPACRHEFAANTEAPATPPPPGTAAPPETTAPPGAEKDEEEFEQPLPDDDVKNKKPRKRRREMSRYGTGAGGYYSDLLKEQRRRTTEHRGVLILVVGLISILCSPSLVISIVCAVIAYNMATNDLNEMMAGRMDRSGLGLTKTGRILSMVGAALGLAVFAFLACSCTLGSALPGLGKH
jgi:hypothetical protein